MVILMGYSMKLSLSSLDTRIGVLAQHSFLFQYSVEQYLEVSYEKMVNDFGCNPCNW
jgi:hypothetical protein